MFLHLGGDITIPKDTVLGIFDLDNSSGSHLTRDFLNRAQKSGNVVTISEDLPKSFIITQENGDIKVYLSQLSTATLRGRSETVGFEIE